MRPRTVLAAIAAAVTVLALAGLAGPVAAAPAPGPLPAPRASDPPPVDRDGDRLADDLAARLDRVGADARVDVIVRGAGIAEARARVGRFDVRRALPLLDGFSARVTAGQARALARVPGVVRVDAVRTVSVSDVSTDRDFGAALARAAFPVTGAGVGVCVIDTGVDPAHEQLTGGPVAFLDVINGRATAYDDHGHGTHVASIALGDGTGGTQAAVHVGVAPQADLYAAKVLDAGGSGANDGVLAGIQWCAAQPGVDVLSMSLGDSVPSDGSDPMSAAVDAVVAPTDPATPGKVVVVAAGNAGDAPSTIPSPGAARQAITVGAVSDWSAPAGSTSRDAGLALAPFSSRGPILASTPYDKPDVTAPGVTVSAADAGTTGGYVAFSGTSMATPYVAGAVALALQARPDATPAAVKAALTASAARLGSGAAANDWGAGLVDVEAFVDALADGTNTDATRFPSWRRVTGTVANGGSTSFPVAVTDATVPLAVTLTITSGSQGCILQWPGAGCVWPGEWSPDLDAELVAPNGSVVATSQCALSGWFCSPVGRQETLLAAAPVLGTYTVRVYAWNGGPGGTFAADVSAGPLTGDGASPPTTNQPPTVSAGQDQTVLTGSARTATVTLTGTASDPDGVASVRWTDQNGSTRGNTYTTTQVLARGTYVFTFTATDTLGASAADSVTVTVKRR